MIVETTISRIPCRVELEYLRGYPGTRDTPPEPAGFIVRRVLDRRGRPAPWLETKMTTDDHDRICQEAWDVATASLEDEAYERSRA